MQRVTIRPATDADAVAIAKIIHADDDPKSGLLTHGEPSPWARRDAVRRLNRSVVAESGGRVVGVLEYECVRRGGRRPIVKLWRNLRAFGVVESVRAARQLWIRSKVALPVPDDALHLAELDVAPEQRNQGIGAQLLDWAEAEARRRQRGCLSLITHSENPAIRLYSRKGFVVEATVTHKRYEKRTGSRARVLMQKPLRAMGYSSIHP